MKRHYRFLIQNPVKLLLLLSSLLMADISYSSQDEMHGVLVTGKHSDISKLKRKDIRRIFLGIKPVDGSHVRKPVINLSNKKTYSEFLKNIMFLTESGYKRKVLKRIFRQGADEIQSISSVPDLTKHLDAHPNDISFMLKDDALNNPNVKIIQALW